MSWFRCLPGRARGTTPGIARGCAALVFGSRLRGSAAGAAAIPWGREREGLNDSVRQAMGVIHPSPFAGHAIVAQVAWPSTGWASPRYVVPPTLSHVSVRPLGEVPAEGDPATRGRWSVPLCVEAGVLFTGHHPRAAYAARAVVACVTGPWRAHERRAPGDRRWGLQPVRRPDAEALGRGPAACPPTP